ncbi:MAG TPA: Gldg family protein [Gammaproteobacteria bacterium]|nr:Gldg family protein [Gammaproteobacteria bacterium]
MTGLGLLVGLILLFALNILSNETLTSARVDLTDGRIYTLSEGTRNVLSKIEEPITLRLYLSKKLATRLPEFTSYAVRVEDLLREYQRESDGNIRLQVIDPEPFSQEEDRAVGYGLRAAPVNNREDMFFFGLVGTNSVDDEEIIPFFTREREEFLEYDVTKLIHNLIEVKQPVVGLLSSLPVEGQGPRAALRGLTSPPWMVVEQMRQLFEVRSLDVSSESIPEDTDVLVLVHPKNLSDRALYAIDQFVLRGGRVLAFVDANAEAEQGVSMGGFMMPARSRRSELDRLLETWGVVLEEDKIIGDLELAARVRMERDGREVTFEYPVWLTVQPEQMNQEDVVTRRLGNLSLGTPGSLVPAETATTSFAPLVQTSRGAAVFSPDQVALSEDPQNLSRIYRPEDRPFTLAARVSGNVQTAFPDGPPKQETAREETPEKETGDEPAKSAPAHLAESEEAVNIIVVADTDLLQDQFWVSVQDFLGTRIAVPTAANGSFVVNAVDNLAGSGDLISVRNRGSFVRPFERISALREQAELRFREKEQELIQRLENTERKLIELEESRQGDDGMVLTPAQQQELMEFRQERLRIRKDLRDVRHRLRREIESLQDWLKFINIALVPIFVALSGMGVAIWRARRRQRNLRAV